MNRSAASTPSSDPQRQQLIDAYLADVRASMAGLDPGEREDVVSMVVEHIDQALAERPRATVRDVEEVLASLGSVDRFAIPVGATTTGPSHGPAAGGPAPAPDRPGGLSTAMLLAGMFAVPLVPLQPFLAAALALIALVVGIGGARSTTGADRRRYTQAAVVGGVLVVLLTLLASPLLGVQLG